MPEVFGALLKALGIVLIGRITADLCKDAGESAIASGVELAVKTAVLLYLVTSVLGLLLTPRKLIAAAYVLLFGLYPIVKYLIECRLPVFTQLSGKLAYFNIVLVLAAVLVSCGLFPQVQMPGIFRLAGLWIAANIGFIVYDIGLSKVIALLRRTLPPE